MGTLSRAVKAIPVAALALGLVGVAAAVTLTSVAAAGPDAAKQRVMITTQAAETTTVSPAVFTPLQTGALKRDSGTISGNWRSILGRNVMRDGQEVTIFDGALWTLTGKRGTLTIRDRNEWVAVGNDDGVAVGNWKVVRGTGQYAGIVGKGRNGHAGLGHPVVRALRGLPHPSVVRCTRGAARAPVCNRITQKGA